MQASDASLPACLHSLSASARVARLTRNCPLAEKNSVI